MTRLYLGRMVSIESVRRAGSIRSPGKVRERLFSAVKNEVLEQEKRAEQEGFKREERFRDVVRERSPVAEDESCQQLLHYTADGASDVEGNSTPAEPVCALALGIVNGLGHILAE
jgi:hypothetical protein